MEYDTSIVPSGTNHEHPRVREKVLENGVASASDGELVMLLLGSGNKNQPVAKLAKKVLETLAASDPENRIEALLGVKGMGLGKTLVIAAALELGRRLNAYTLAPIKKPADIVPFVQHYAIQPTEHFICVTLNGAHEILQIHPITSGTVNRTLIHPREIFTDAIKERAFAVIICHNHPSGSCRPSREDIRTTERLYQASKVLGIHILDHLILTRTEFYSFRQHGAVFDDSSYEF